MGKAQPWWLGFVGCGVGGVLLSHTLPCAVPLALVGLASGFGMGPGVSPPLLPPTGWWGGCWLLILCSGRVAWCGVVVFGGLVPVTLHIAMCAVLAYRPHSLWGTCW